ncbi:MAG: hypothetical protein JW746_00650 [Candidatus Krumholzibacteriota bacterium]|nr:hypothetical protein [Candidatus Krumholzibacteriota bacterium]
MGFRSRKRAVVVSTAILIAVAGVTLVSQKIHEKQAHIWLPGYIKQAAVQSFERDKIQPKHILFIYVDHFEPRCGRVDKETEAKRVDEWSTAYREMASKHMDADGVKPQHSWFYPYDEINLCALQKLADLCYEGFGEIEFHHHHSNDTEISLSAKYADMLIQYNKVGALVTAEADPQKRFGFIHGNWALDNSRILEGINACGVNNELTLLKRFGCYADFTLPAFSGKAQSSKINSIYYAHDDPDKPKSYDSGIDAQVGVKNTEDLLIIQGPLWLDWGDMRHIFYPVLENGEIEAYLYPEPRRIDLWIKANVHVKGRPDWVFVKVFSHSAPESSRAIATGKPFDDLLGYLEENYNDGDSYVLHYVTAREAYNIVRAAEDGKEGDPGQYRDYEIPQYANRIISSSVFYNLNTYSQTLLDVDNLQFPQNAVFSFHHQYLKSVTGEVQNIRFQYDKTEKMGSIQWTGRGDIDISVQLPDADYNFGDARLLDKEKLRQDLWQYKISLRGTESVQKTEFREN